MRIQKIHFIVLVCAIIAGVYLSLGPSESASPARASVNNYLKGWAWSENIGWISMNCDKLAGEGGNTCATSNYAVGYDTATKKFSGWAWSENIGWISFNSEDVNSASDATKRCPDYSPTVDNCTPWLDQNSATNWIMRGWVRALSANSATGWDGWIKLASADGAAIQHGVQFDPETSRAVHGGTSYAWGSTVVGWVDFAPTLEVGGMINSPVTFSPLLTSRTIALSISNPKPVFVAGSTATVNLQVLKGGVADTTASGTATIRIKKASDGTMSATAKIAGTTGDYVATISNGTASFNVTNMSGEQDLISVIAVAPFGADLVDIPINFGKITISAVDNVETKNDPATINMTYEPAAVFSTCSRSSTPTNLGWDALNDIPVGSKTVTVSAKPTTFTVTCSGVSVSKDIGFKEAPVVYLDAIPKVIQGSGDVTLTYQSSGAPVTSCVADSVPVNTSWNGNISIGNLPAGESMAPKTAIVPGVSQTTTFGLTCVGNGKTSARVATNVTVAPVVQQPRSISAPSKVKLRVSNQSADGYQATISWDVTGQAASGWSCYGGQGNDPTHWNGRTLTGGSVTVINQESGVQSYEIICMSPDGADRISDVANVGDGVVPVFENIAELPSITFVSNKKEVSNTLRVKLKQNGIGPVELHIASPTLGTQFRGKMKKSVSVSDKAERIEMEEADFSSGADLTLELDNAPTVPAGQPYLEYPVTIYAVSSRHGLIVGATTTTLRVKNMIPNFTEN